jgi:hypothetical protein
MSKFGHIKNKVVNISVAKFRFPLADTKGKRPTYLYFKPFKAEHNPELRNFTLDYNASVNRDAVDPNDDEYFKKAIKELLLVGWENLYDVEGNEVSFETSEGVRDQSTIEDLLGAMPNWVFMDIIEFCSDIYNFTDEKKRVSSEEITKNSVSG